MKRFALIGAAGFVAPRHLKAINQTGNKLIAAIDPHDSVGILDSYSPDAAFFTSYERFERHISKLMANDETKLDYISICSPNYLHDTHIRLGLQNGINVICEKPLVLNKRNLDLLDEIKSKSQNEVYTVMQLRNHPNLIALKHSLSKFNIPNQNIIHEVELNYITPRGNWYFNSWKGEIEKSGGIATNIGIHLFDLLIWLFGEVVDYEVELNSQDKMRGSLKLKNANVKWFLSVDINDLPETAIQNNKNSFRSLLMDGNLIEFSDGFTDLHTVVYQNILKGKGLSIDDARPSIELVEKLRNTN